MARPKKRKGAGRKTTEGKQESVNSQLEVKQESVNSQLEVKQESVNSQLEVKLKSLCDRLEEQMHVVHHPAMVELCDALFKEYGHKPHHTRKIGSAQPVYGLVLEELSSESIEGLDSRLQNLSCATSMDSIQVDSTTESISLCMQALIVQAFLAVHRSEEPKIDAVKPEIDIRLSRLSTTITRLEPGSDEYEGLEQLTYYNQFVLNEIFVLNRQSEAEHFKKRSQKGNLLCFHGTYRERLCSILNKGLMIKSPFYQSRRPFTYGAGIYFTNDLDLAYRCACPDEKKGGGVMLVFLAELDTGPTTAVISSKLGGRTTICEEWPDLKDDIIMPDGCRILDQMPLGRLVIKDESRIRLRYLLKIGTKKGCYRY